MMKKVQILMFICLLLSVVSCKKYLEVSPEFGLDETDVFSDYNGVRGYLDKCYAALSDYHEWKSQNLQRTNINALSDEMGSLFVEPLNTTLNTGDWFNKPTAGEVGWESAAADQATPVGAVISNAFI